MSAPRRELAAAVAVCAGSAALALAAAGQPWVRAVARRAAPGPGRPDGFVDVVHELTGRRLAPAAAAWALLALAGAVAVLATRRSGRTVTGALLFGAGAVVAGLALRVRLDPAGYAAGALAAAELLGARVRATAWPAVATLAGFGLAATGVAVVLRGRRWPVLSARYARTAAERPRGAPATEAEMWDAIDRGEDVTG